MSKTLLEGKFTNKSIFFISSLSFDNLCKSKAETVSLYQLWESGNVSQQVLLSRDYEERATLNHFRALKYLEENACI